MYPDDAVFSVAEIESCCLLFQNILKRTKERTPEEQTASKALASVAKVNAPHSSPSLLPTNPYNLTLECFASGNLTSAIVWVKDFLLIELRSDSESCITEDKQYLWVFVRGMNLILPMTHGPFYITAEGNMKEKESLDRYFIILSLFFFTRTQIIDECNTEVGKMRQMEELIHVSQTLEFDKLKVNSNTHSKCVRINVFILKKER